MIYKEVATKRLHRKKEQLAELEKRLMPEGELSPIDKHKLIECKAAIIELGYIIDIAESMFSAEPCEVDSRK